MLRETTSSASGKPKKSIDANGGLENLTKRQLAIRSNAARREQAQREAEIQESIDSPYQEPTPEQIRKWLVVESVDGKRYRIDDIGIVRGYREAEEIPRPSETIICLRWLSMALDTESKRVWTNSYRLKNLVEKQTKTYVSNGSLIQAAAMLSLPIRYRPQDRQNCDVKIPRILLKREVSSRDYLEMQD